MSIQAVFWAITTRVGDPTLKVMLIAIANYADQEGECFPSQNQLAFDTEISKRSVSRALDRLHEAGLIELKERFRDDGGRTSNLIRLIGFTPPAVDGMGAPAKKGPSPPTPESHGAHANKVAGANEPLLNHQSNKKAAPSMGTRIPDDWQLTPDLGNYGRSKGLTRNEVLAEAEKFVNYWRSAAGAKARKVDWDLTWKGWILRTAERLGRRPPDLPPEPPPAAEMDRNSWEIASRLYANSSNWHRQWGPEPGHPRCLMPPDLQQQFVSTHH